MATKKFRVNLDCHCKSCPGYIKTYVKKIKGFWRKLFEDSDSLLVKASQGCPCREEIKRHLQNVKGVDEIVEVDLAKGTVTLRGHFKEDDVINCLWEKMEKKAEVVVDGEEPTRRNYGFFKAEQPRRGRIYGEIEELW